ncbi:MAG: outer rane beta-barrel protein [Ferruginibacter sp.]|nr:outer rane beta-barrel protein [Ferruginibacter sp.]
MKPFLLVVFLSCFISGFSQTGRKAGIIAGNLVDEQGEKAILGATVNLTQISDSSYRLSMLSDADGSFAFDTIPYGYYRLSVRFVGYAPMRIDSIYLREERADFNLSDIRMKKSVGDLESVVVYAEKPLFENKDGKMTFNASESALSNSSTTTELLKQTPLVNVDADGKILMRGKEVKILIDDKPVDLDARQLQDLLESMPGSMIEKIEVLTTPPPQYANERGGVINIVTKKGKVGMSGRLNLNYGTRGEAGVSGSFSYRKNKLSLNFNAGYSHNDYDGNSYSYRENIYKDSSNFFNTLGNNSSRIGRPNSRLSVDYALNKRNSLNATLLYNSNENDGNSNTEYSNVNRFDQLYRLSRRNIGSYAANQSPSANFSYSLKGKNPLAVLRIITAFNYNFSENERNFYQQYLNLDSSFTGNDSTQQQLTAVSNRSTSLRVNYDRPLNKKWYLSVGGNLNNYLTHNRLNTAFLKKPDNVLVKNNVLSNDFYFYQDVYALRAALRYQFNPDFFITAGLQQEYSETSFDIVDNPDHFKNDYFSPLPFINLTKKWEKGYNLTGSYKRSIQRPGINNLNPSIDYSDPYNTRFGNPYLQPYYADNFDLITGYWSKKFNLNVSVGYNALQQIYSSIRTLQTDGKTTTTWQNLSGRKEYESSFWGGMNIGKKIKANASIGYTYNVYSEHDRTLNRFRNGGSIHSSINGNYIVSSLLTATGNFTFNRFSNPQGTVRTALSMNLGVQQKLFKKNMTVSLNVVDPFRQQQNNYFTFGPNYNLESYSRNNSRNFRVALSYTFKKANKKAVKKILQKPAAKPVKAKV